MNKQTLKLQHFNKSIYKSYLTADQVYYAFSDMFSGSEDFVNFASASDMNLLHDDFVRDLFLHLTSTDRTNITKYPKLSVNDSSLESRFADFLKKWTGAAFSPGSVISFHGAFGSYGALVSALNGEVILCSDIAYDYQKACFVGLGKKLFQVPTLSDGLLSIEHLESLCNDNKGKISILYFNYGTGTAYTSDYLIALADLAKKFGFIILCDLDVFYTNHVHDKDCALPLKIPEFIDNSIVVINSSKELGVPAVRVGFGVSSPHLVKELKVFQDMTLDIKPRINKEILSYILDNIDLEKSKNILISRMHTLVSGLNSLGWEVSCPDVGINLFVDVPPSFRGYKDVVAGEMFSYYCMKTVHTKIRPGNINGKKLHDKCRFVISTTKSQIEDVIERFKLAGIRYNMELPAGLLDDYLPKHQKILEGLWISK